MTDQWYYVDGVARIGPLAASEIQRLIASDRLGPAVLVWHDGMSDWARADAHFDFPAANASGGPPPVPPEASLPGDSGRSGGNHAVETAQVAGGTTGPDGLYIHAPARGFGEAITVCLQKYFTFSGRASRSEYWFFVFFLFLLGSIATVFDAILFGTAEWNDVSPLNSIFVLATLFPSMAVAWRRLHDTNRSGWWAGAWLLALLALPVLVVILTVTVSAGGIAATVTPFVLAFVAYSIVLIVFAAQRGDPGPNRFG